MPNVDFQRELEENRVAVERAVTVQASATTLINGHTAALAALKAELEALGVTPEQLVPFDAYTNALIASTDELAEAVEANT